MNAIDSCPEYEYIEPNCSQLGEVTVYLFLVVELCINCFSDCSDLFPLRQEWQWMPPSSFFAT